MKKTFDLLAFELHRVRILYPVLVLIIALMQITAIVDTNQNYMSMLEHFQITGQGNLLDFKEYWGPTQFTAVTGHLAYVYSLFVGVFTLLIYSVVIWYQDWWGKNNLSYRLLALPGSRMSIFFSKLLAILFMMVGLIAFQVVMLYVGNELFELISHPELLESTSIRQNIEYNAFLYVILPNLIFDFFLHYTIGIAALTLVFMMIVIALCYKLKGMFVNAAIIVGGIALGVAGARFDVFRYLFVREILYVAIALSFLVFFLSLWISRKLLQEKITV